MPRQISELQSIPFYQLIGAPVLALVQGQSQAAQATAEFIERVGFVTGETAEAGTEAEKADFIGRLRMVSFTCEKPDMDGIPKTFEIKVPLLSLVPIPAIQIKDADMEFNIKVTDVITSEIKTALQESEKSTEVTPGQWLAPTRVEFRTAMGRLDTAVREKQAFDVQMNVKMRVEQADIPAGLSFIFRLMEDSITGEIVPSAEEPAEEAPEEEAPEEETPT